MKKVLTIAAVVAVLALTGCSAPQLDAEGNSIRNPEQAAEDEYNEILREESESSFVSNSLVESTILLRDGREVTCVAYHEYRAGGVSCDWEGAN